MKFSIVIPAFNEAKHIKHTIECILAQSVNRSDFEIIVVDNNSTDNTSEVARKAGADKVIKEIKKGPNMARNRGYLKSKGDIIAFVDADSHIPSNWLTKIEDKLSNPKIMAVSGPYDYGFKGVKRFLDVLYTNMFFPKVPSLLKFLFGKKAGVIIGGNFAAKRHALEKIGGIPEVSFWGDDAVIAMHISRKAGKVLFDPKITIKSSPRRFEESGFLKLPFLYAKAYLRAYFSKS